MPTVRQIRATPVFESRQFHSFLLSKHSLSHFVFNASARKLPPANRRDEQVIDYAVES